MAARFETTIGSWKVHIKRIWTLEAVAQCLRYSVTTMPYTRKTSACLAAVVIVAIGLAIAIAYRQHRPEKPATPQASVDEASDPSASSPTESESPSTPLDWELQDDKQKELWDIEHLVFMLGRNVINPLAEALETGNALVVKGYFRPEFTGTSVRTADRLSGNFQYGTFFQTRYDDENFDGTRRAADEQGLDGFVAWLLAQRATLDRDANVKCRIKEFTRVQDSVSEEQSAWLTFRGALEIGISGQDQEGRPRDYEWLFALECKVDPDALFADARVISRLEVLQEELNKTDAFLFEDVTEDVGLRPDRLHDNWTKPHAHRMDTGGIYAADYNEDGWIDLLVTDPEAGCVLYRGAAPGRFQDVTEEAGLAAFRNCGMAAGWADLDNDGDLDIVLVPHVLSNNGDGTFYDVTKLSNLSVTVAAQGIVLADYDRDGWVDMYVLYQSRQTGQGALSAPAPFIMDQSSGAPNVLWRNLGRWQFEDVTELTGTGGGTRQTFAAVWFDANEDGWPDLYVANDFADNFYFLNVGDGTFSDASAEAGLQDYGTSMGVGAGDFDGDGLLDLYVSNMFSGAGRRIIANAGRDNYPESVFKQLIGTSSGNTLYKNLGNNRFSQVQYDSIINRVGWAYAGLFVDVDNNGWNDIYAPSGFVSTDVEKPDS